MAKFNNRARKWKGRVTVTVPAVAGQYAEARLTFGLKLNEATAPAADESFEEVQVLIEGGAGLASAVVELWLRKVSDDTEGATTMTDDDYTLAGSNFTSVTATGSGRWVLSGWPGGQIRVKSGGSGGPLTLSACAL